MQTDATLSSKSVAHLSGARARRWSMTNIGLLMTVRMTVATAPSTHQGVRNDSIRALTIIPTLDGDPVYRLRCFLGPDLVKLKVDLWSITGLPYHNAKLGAAVRAPWSHSHGCPNALLRWPKLYDSDEIYKRQHIK